MSRLDFQSGTIGDSPPTSVRTLGDIAAIFKSPPDPTRLSEVVYRTYGCSADDTETPNLVYASTVLEAGEVNGEYFMTRGHFHVNSNRGEWMMTTAGEGHLVLMDRDGRTSSEPMCTGSLHLIDGRFAHRVVNTGLTALVFMVVWLSDCGHDYDFVTQNGFGINFCH